MASVVDICNSALQKLGAKRIVSLTENSPNARSCNAAYSNSRDAELQAHPWNFAVKRVELAADAVPPIFGKANSYTLPGDFLRLLAPDPGYNCVPRDWQIEGTKILTRDQAPLHLRYVALVTDTTLMVPTFREALACRLASEMCEEITQSNSKKASVNADYKDALREARRINALANPPVTPNEDSWITARI